ncbi:glycosyltransferase [Synechocystis salina LEGE 06099]|uniref:glycosyltransferase family 2 protein n=1 Tax=Synechocystis salina TaxID=945780 RepID=UPI001881313A|nr:glycosyltransferase family 2 protein [Synechocystis salina]MBE9203868.1 glycosyltransferase [Synechocystis salina LEGE 06099]
MKKIPKILVTLNTLLDNPLVSIVVPSYNQGEFIKETIDSILIQDYAPIEIIVIDGASTDNTVEILKSYGDTPDLIWRSEPDKGVVDAVNKGFALAQGEIIGIQSSDDFYLPHAVKTMVKALQTNPDVGLTFADIVTIDSEDNELRRTNFPPFSLEGFLSKDFYIPQPSAFFRRELLDIIGGWNDKYFVADTEFWLRMVFNTKVLKIDSCIAKRRLHQAQRNHEHRKIFDSYRHMIDNSENLASAPLCLQKAAKIGTHLNCIRYNPTNSHLQSTCHLWRAILLRPALLGKFSNSPLLIPGYLQLRILASRLKQNLTRITRDILNTLPQS